VAARRTRIAQNRWEHRQRAMDIGGVSPPLAMDIGKENGPTKGFMIIEKHAMVSENVCPGDSPSGEMLKQMMSLMTVNVYRYTRISAICGAASVAPGTAGASSSRSSRIRIPRFVQNHDGLSGDTYIASENRRRWASRMVFSGRIGICGAIAGCGSSYVRRWSMEARSLSGLATP
jgi:hypothetical protein